MVLAAVSWEAFWSDYALVFGTMLVLLSLLQTGMTKRWTWGLTAFGTGFLAIGAAIVTVHDFKTYGHEHLVRGGLAFIVFMGTLIFVLARFLCAQRTKRVPGNEDEGQEKKCCRQPIGEKPGNDAVEQSKPEIAAAKRHDNDADALVGDTREAPVQPVKEAPSDASQQK